MTSRNIFWWDNDNCSMHCLDWTMVSSSIYIEGSLQTAILNLIQEQKRLVFVWFFLLEGKSTELSFPKRATTLSGRRSGSHVRSESKRLPKKNGNSPRFQLTRRKRLSLGVHDDQTIVKASNKAGSRIIKGKWLQELLIATREQNVRHEGKRSRELRKVCHPLVRPA